MVWLAVALDEFDGFVRAKMRLMQMRRHIVIVARGDTQPAESRGFAGAPIVIDAGDIAPLQDAVRVDALRLQPLHIFVARLVAALVIVAVLEVAVAVVDALFAALEGGGQVQFADESAVVAGLAQTAGQQALGIMRGEAAVAIAIDADGAGVHASQKTGAAGRADWRLAVGMREGGGFTGEAVEIGRADMRIAQRADGVKALLVAAIPEDVGAGGHG